jgi:two-component system alkaline phosphatase synthesis response regulator PhoP
MPVKNAQASSPATSRRTILVIDDDIPTLELLSATFSLEGYRVVDAVNGREGLTRMNRDRPDIILCDVLMPDVDGRGFSEALHADASYRDIPLVLVSAGQETTVAKGIEYSAFVEKPFSVSALLALVRQLIDMPQSQIPPKAP